LCSWFFCYCTKPLCQSDYYSDPRLTLFIDIYAWALYYF
jgi:hypothetical protein